MIAVHAVTEWALEQARQGKGPVLIEAFTYRVGAHTTADDPTKYRESAEEPLWRAKDPLARLEKYLRAEGLADDAFFDRSRPTATNSPPMSARPPTTSKPRTSGLPSPTPTWRPTRWWPRSWPGSRNTAQVSPTPTPRPAAAGQAEQTDRGGPLMTTMTIAKAINEGLRATLNNNPRSLLMGEDIGALGGVYRVTDGLIAEFGADRVVDTPLAESGIIGTAIGLALRGYQPVCEIQFDGFVFPGFNQITTQLAKMHSRSNGNLTVPMIVTFFRSLQVPCFPSLWKKHGQNGVRYATVWRQHIVLLVPTRRQRCFVSRSSGSSPAWWPARVEPPR